MILLVFVEYYESLLEVAMSEKYIWKNLDKKLYNF